MTPAVDWLGLPPRRWQPEALDAVLAAMRSGCRAPVVQATCGAGKSVFLAELAARCKGTVVVTTPTQALTEQLGATLAARCSGAVALAYQHGWPASGSDAPRVVVTCAASLPRLLAERPEWDCWLADEAHIGLPALPRARVAVALTATPFAGRNGRGAPGVLGAFHRLVYALTAAQAIADGILVESDVQRWDGQQHAGLPPEEQTDAIVRDWVLAADGTGVVTAQTTADADRFAAMLGEGFAPLHQGVPRGLRLERLAALRSGALRGLVSVNMLVTGVDIPELRWLALRVPVSSPVRLVQLVGRVLRAAPGKGRALLMDPHDALGVVGLTHTAALDSVLAAAPPEEPDEWEIPELEGLGDLATLPAPVAVGRLEGWVSDLLAALRASGEFAVRARPADEGREWRGARATDGQRKALAGLMGRAVGRLPEPYREPFRWLLRREDLRRGTASDALDCLAAVMRRWREVRERDGHPYWRLPKDLVPEVPAGAEAA